MQSFVKIYALVTHSVTLKNVPTNVASITLFSGRFYLIVNFKVTIRKNMPLYT